jgi:hypothetical protein
MNKETKTAIVNAMGMFLENDDSFGLGQKIDIMDHLHNAIYVATSDTQVTPLPNRLSLLGNIDGKATA